MQWIRRLRLSASFDQQPELEDMRSVDVFDERMLRGRHAFVSLVLYCVFFHLFLPMELLFLLLSLLCPPAPLFFQLFFILPTIYCTILFLTGMSVIFLLRFVACMEGFRSIWPVGM